jgi:hypothetical protein
MTKRFATSLDVNQLLTLKYSKGTDSFDQYAERILNEFITLANLTINYQDGHGVCQKRQWEIFLFKYF